MFTTGKPTLHVALTFRSRPRGMTGFYDVERLGSTYTWQFKLPAARATPQNNIAFRSSK